MNRACINCKGICDGCPVAQHLWEREIEEEKEKRMLLAKLYREKRVWMSRMDLWDEKMRNLPF